MPNLRIDPKGVIVLSGIAIVIGIIIAVTAKKRQVANSMRKVAKLAK